MRTLASESRTRTPSITCYYWALAASTRDYVRNGLNRYTSVSGTAHAYDGRGNLTSDGARTLAYDVENRPISVGGSANLSLSYCLTISGAAFIAVSSLIRASAAEHLLNAPWAEVLRVAFLFSGGYLLLSGFLISAFLLGAFHLPGRNFIRRAVTICIAFTTHFVLFYPLVASDPVVTSDVPFLALGVLAVVSAELLSWKAAAYVQERQ